MTKERRRGDSSIGGSLELGDAFATWRLAPFYIKPGEAWVLNDPKELYTQTKAFHVTASSALQNLTNGGILLPSYDIGIHGNIETHRGPAGTVAEYLLATVFGINQQGSPLLVWAGTKVDNQQVMIEGEISRNPGKAGGSIYSTFFQPRDDSIHTLSRSFVSEEEQASYLAACASTAPTHLWNERFVKFVESLENESGDGYADVATNVLKSLWMATGMRDGWYNQVASILRRETKLPEDLYDQILRDYHDGTSPYYHTLLNNLRNQKSVNDDTAQAVILQINPQRVFSRHKDPLLVMPGNNRPRDPRSIIGLPNVTLDDVDVVYVESTQILPESVCSRLTDKKIPLIPMSSFPENDRMMPSRGFSFETSEMDPRNPLCLLRYEYDPDEVRSIYRAAYQRGALHPLFDINLANTKQRRNLVDRLGPRWPNRILRGVRRTLIE